MLKGGLGPRLPYYSLQSYAEQVCKTSIQCYTMLYNVIQCYTMLYNVIQCYTVLYSVIQYSLLSPGVGMYVLNTEYFGHLLRPNTYSSLQEAANAFLNFKLQTLGRHSKVRSYLPVSLPVLHLSCCLWQYNSTAGDRLRWRIWGEGGEEMSTLHFPTCPVLDV